MNTNKLQFTQASATAPPGPLPSCVSFPEDREELLRKVRDLNPELEVEDAFEVPGWFAQQKEWFNDPTGSDSVVYNYPLLFRIRGRLNERALQRSLQEVVRRHGVFRSVFRMVAGRLVQIVFVSQEFALSMTELNGSPEAPEQQMLEAARKEALKPFDLLRGPMLRGQLLRLGIEDHILQLTTHHLVHDDWSTGILIRETSELYTAIASGITPDMPPVSFHYGDFVRWQHERLRGPELQPILADGKKQLDFPAVFNHLPIDFTRSTRDTHDGARQSATLPAGLADSLNALCRKERASLFMVLLAAFKCLLHRYSGDEEIGVISCAANRQLEEIEGLIGRFGNDMILRTSLSGNPSFGELLKRVREVTLTASMYQELPFGMFCDSRGKEKNRTNAFQIMFILQNAPKEKWRLPGLRVEWLPLETGTSKHDLIVWLKTEPALEITLEYNTQVFGAAGMKRLLADYQAVLQGMAKNPQERMGNIELSSKPETSAVKSVPESGRKTVVLQHTADVEARMIVLWKKVFGFHTIDVAQNFFELGGDSIMAARLFEQIKKTFDRALPLTVLLEAPTIRQLSQILCDKTTCSSTSLVPVRTKGAHPPLFLVHGHGGEPLFCWKLSGRLGPDQPVYGLRSRAHCGEPMQHSVPEMAAHYLETIRGVQPDGPYYLGGYCFGGMVAYEMARMLTEQGHEVAFLAMFNTPAPGSLRGWPLNLNYLKGRTLHELGKLSSGGIRPKLKILGVKPARFVRLTLGSGKAALRNVFSKSSLPKNDALTQGLLSVSDANVAAAKSYHPGKYSGRITFFSTREVSTYYSVDPKEGWLSFADGGVEYHPADGDNNSLFDETLEKPLAEKLKKCLERAVALSSDRFHRRR